MAKPMTAAQWRAQLKKFGQPYRELSTFKDPESGRSSETGKEFGPVVGGLIHHTAGPADQPNNADDATDSRIVNDGRAGLPGPLAHAGATDDGIIELHTTDRANHAGNGDRDVYNAVMAESYGDYPPRANVDEVDGNDCLYGLEMYYPGTSSPKAAQYRAAVNWAAAFCDFHGWTAKSAIGHKEWTRRKIDPGYVDMAKFRRHVAMRIAEVNAPPAPEPVTTHPRWATRETAVCNPAGGKVLRMIPAGYRFQVIDGSGHGADGWVQTSAGNWVLGADTTIYDPAEPVEVAIMGWNVENTGDADAALDRAEIIALVTARKPHYFALEEVYRVDLSDIPGYQTYRAWDGYTVESENRGQALLVRNDVAIKIQQALAMTEEWTGPKMGLAKEPRVHRYVTGNYHGKNIPVATFHVPFGAAAVKETRLAAIAWLKEMKAAHGRGVIVGDWNSLADALQAKVGDPAGATVDGGGLDRAVFVGLKKVKGENLGNRGRSDHPVKVWTFEA